MFGISDLFSKIFTVHLLCANIALSAGWIKTNKYSSRPYELTMWKGKEKYS